VRVLAVLENARSDVMLPANSVDIRYENLVTRKLFKKRNGDMSWLQDFIDSSIFEIQRGRMKTPPSLTVPIDRAMLTEEAQAALRFSAETQHVEYIFAGLEIHKRISLVWKGWRLCYSSIDAGRAGGCRSELRLLPISTQPDSSQADFIKASIEIAHEIGENPALLEVALASGNEHASQNQHVEEEQVTKEKEEKPKKPKKLGKRERQAKREKSTHARHWKPSVLQDENVLMKEQEAVWDDWDAEEGPGFDFDFDVEDLVEDDAEQADERSQ
jgi:hypothetical protein